MDVVSTCSLRAQTLVWQPRPSTWVLTVVCKATFVLRPGECSLASEQEAPVDADEHWNDDPTRSVRAVNELVPVKPRADIFLVGHAFAPAGTTVRSIVARVIVGAVDKSIEVHNDRVVSPNGTTQEGGAFVRQQLTYERAAGGPGTWNPPGIHLDTRDSYGRRILPNLVAPGTQVTDMNTPIEPIGFGPLASGWSLRLEKAGAYASRLPNHGYHEWLVPEGMDLGYFNQAPADQQVVDLRENERIVLENLHPEHSRLVTNLPGLKPAIFISRPRAPQAQRIALRADTLGIDTDRGIATLLFRGQIPLDGRDEAVRVAVLLEPPGHEVKSVDADRALGRPHSSLPVAMPNKRDDDPAGMTLMGPLLNAVPNTAAPLPFVGTAHTPAPRKTPSTPAPPGILPFQSGQAIPPPAPRPPPRVPPSAPPPRPPSGSSPWFQAVQPPAPAVESKWAAGPSEAKLGQPETIGMAAAAAAAVAVSTPNVDEASRAGAAAASNAAAGATPWSVPKRDLNVVAARETPFSVGAGNEVISLIWYDPASVPRIRRHAKWRSVLDDLEKKPLDRELEDPALAKDPMEAEDRREVFEIVARASQMDARGVEEAFVEAIRDDGKAIAPLVLLAGELETPFDELATLRATVSTSVAFMGPTDEGLKASVSIAKEFLATPELAAAPAVCEGLSTRIREAFHREKKSLSGDFLETQVERFLVSGRHYQIREVFGEAHIRVLVWLPGESNGLVGYLPATLAKKLPMWKRFRARVIAEVHQAQDQYESQVRGLRIVAVGRGGAKG